MYRRPGRQWYRTVSMPVETVAYRYGLLPPLDWGEDVESQLRAQNDLWNKLVEIDRAFRERVRAVAAADAEVITLEAQRAPLLDGLVQLKDQRARERQRLRTRARTPELDAAIAEKVAALRDLAPITKEARKRAYGSARMTLRAIEDERIGVVKAARQEAANKGLWWGNYNAVIDSYETARKRAAKEGADLHFHRYSEAEGRLTNQIQGGMTVKELFSGGHSQVQVVPHHESPTRTGRRWRNHVQQVALRATAFTSAGNRRMVTWPLIMHRPLPEDARIQMVTVHRRKVADRNSWHVVFVLRAPVRERAPTEDAVAVNLGWRKTPTGLRVAAILRHGAEYAESITLPQRMVDGVVAGERNRGDIDRELNAMRAWLSKLDAAQAGDETQRVVAALRNVPHPGARGRHFEWLRTTWERDCPKWRAADLEELRKFGRRWRRYLRDDACGRHWFRDARRDHFRTQVKHLIGNAAVIIINAHDMSETAESDALPGPVQHNRAIAAPSECRLAILNHARKTGAKVVVYGGAHDRCGCHGLPFGTRDRTTLRWACPASHLGVDQDEDYCRLMLREQRGVGETDGGARDEETVELKRSYRPNRKSDRPRGAAEAGSGTTRSNPSP